MGAEVRNRLIVWAALMALLALTVALSFAPLGPFRLAASLAIAAAKAALIYWVFMDLRTADGLTRIAALCAIGFLAMLLLLTGLDAAVRAHLMVGP
jgi:cytochrome c oxidase subunit 4